MLPLVVKTANWGSAGPYTVDQVKAGGLVMVLPNWSRKAGTTGCRLVPVTYTVVTAGYLVEVHTCVTTTDLTLLTERPPASTILTVNEYVPAMEKVAVEACAAFVPLLLKVTVPPDGADVTDHVYVRFAAPPSSVPRTESEAVLPVTAALPLMLIGWAMVGRRWLAPWIRPVRPVKAKRKGYGR